MAKQNNNCTQCNHEEKYHANKERHERKTGHCTLFDCGCQEYVCV